MEISLLNEDAHIEYIKGYKVLRYKVKRNGKNINKIHLLICLKDIPKINF